jgi:hypothetical protein
MSLRIMLQVGWSDIVSRCPCGFMVRARDGASREIASLHAGQDALHILEQYPLPLPMQKANSVEKAH